MILLFLACPGPSASAAPTGSISIYQGSCDYVTFPEKIQIDPGAGYLVQTCGVIEDGRTICTWDDYYVDQVGLIMPYECPAGKTWRITEMRPE